MKIQWAINSFKPLKVHGPDVLHPIFLQKYWTDTKSAIIKICNDAFASSIIHVEINNTFITLIPKVKNVEHISQYISISLCNTVYKTITIIIVNRICPFLKHLISPNQCSFLPGRRVVYNTILVQEAIHSFQHMLGCTGNIMLKIDLEKAFDRLEWSFIRKSLHNLGFSTTIINLIVNCISPASISIMINCKPIKCFEPSSGVFPYIFIFFFIYFHNLNAIFDPLN